MDDTSLTTFTQVLVTNERRQGVNAEMFEKMSMVAMAARASGKSGHVSLKIIIEPDKNDEHALTFDADITFKAPRPKRPKAIMYQNADGSFTKSDPRQLELLAEKEAEREEREERIRAAGAVALTQVGRNT